MVTVLTLICCCVLLVLAVLIDIALCIPVALIVGAIYGVWFLIKWLINEIKE